MLPRIRLRQVATAAALVVAALPLTAAASPWAAAPPPVLHPGPVDAWTGATFDRVGGTALVGGLAMVAFLLVAGVAAVVVAARTLLAARPTPGSTSHRFHQAGAELVGTGGGASGSSPIPAPRRPLPSGAWTRLSPTR